MAWTAYTVSNHGGRSLDYSPSTLEVLPEIVDAVGGKVPILFDSGVRRGSDALKALALGANAVCLGRVPRWGLGAYGAPGVQRILEILQGRTGAGHGLHRPSDPGIAQSHDREDRLSMTKLTRRRALAAYWSFARGRAKCAATETGGRACRVESRPSKSWSMPTNSGPWPSAAWTALTFAEIEGSDRAAFERITFRPRLMVDSRQMDLSTELLGQSLFTPIMVGPVSNQTRYHPEGELAMARGAAAAKAGLIVAARSEPPDRRDRGAVEGAALVSGGSGGRSGEGRARRSSGPSERDARRSA